MWLYNTIQFLQKTKNNSQEYSPIKRALDTRVTRSHNNKDTLLEKARFLMEDL